MLAPSSTVTARVRSTSDVAGFASTTNALGAVPCTSTVPIVRGLLLPDGTPVSADRINLFPRIVRVQSLVGKVPVTESVMEQFSLFKRPPYVLAALTRTDTPEGSPVNKCRLLSLCPSKRFHWADSPQPEGNIALSPSEVTPDICIWIVAPFRFARVNGDGEVPEILTDAVCAAAGPAATTSNKASPTAAPAPAKRP